tara:strand:+ start:597 stop:770 length:174 start_codon:yes stop_codon:yes gene_type:complete
MRKKSENLKNTYSWIGVGTAIGAIVFALTNEPTWIAVGVAVGAALDWRKPKNKMKQD